MVPVEKWTPERRRQRTREALLDAAAEVFAKRGFHAASLDEIAETAGYTRGAIYKHFADKEELLHEVCVRLNERMFAEFDELPGTFDDFHVESVTAHWRAMVERDTEFRLVMLEFLLHAMRHPEQRERAREFGRANVRAIADYITQRTIETGQTLPIPADDVAAILGIASDGFAQAAMIDADAARLFGIFLDLVTRGLRASTTDSEQPT